METDSSTPSWLSYVQLLDSALPIGGFSHSFGLETLVQLGMVQRPEQLREYIETMLKHSWAPVDALAVKAVYQYAPVEAWPSLWKVDRMQHVQRIAIETREGVLKMGRRLSQLAQAVHPELPWEPLQEAIRAKHCFGTHPLIHGWVSYHLKVPLDMAAEGYLYTCATTSINSGLRLMSIGQTEGQRLLGQLLPVISRSWREVSHLDALDDGYSNTPSADIAMMRHESLYSRLFMS
ncbi:urease accessory protein UreF [Paenibacillus sp. OAS669]|uniref:urease accessory protein UreF n=1 Tax=Paenibacillus sp. OAS669 TaxID=2663821 RepID=UPI00178B153B|nr:urease accessory protein UreF [Paenibacillus sp. OAS669]MBE1444521.1 urease accessory protein [Paenibacillus sp. OAS669]